MFPLGVFGKRAIVWSLIRCQTTADTVRTHQAIHFNKTINLTFYHPFGPRCYFLCVVIPLTVHWDLRLFLQICDFSHARGHLLDSFDGLRKKRDCSWSNWYLSFVVKLTIHQAINQLCPRISVTWIHLDTTVKNSMIAIRNLNKALLLILFAVYSASFLVSRETPLRVASFISASKHRRKTANLKSSKS